MSARRLRILAQGPDWVAIDKPAGFVAHPLEDPRHRIPKQFNCLPILRDQLGQRVYPLHRLDRATSGVLLYALSSEAAAKYQSFWLTNQVRKAYVVLVRGWLTQPQRCERPLTHEDPAQAPLPATTDFIPIAQAELPHPCGKYASFRTSLIWALPHSGRFHQIRRHLKGLSHPIVGDTVHGDGAVNRLARTLGWDGLQLKAQGLAWPDQPWITSRWTGHWHRVFDTLGQCPTAQPPKPLIL